METIYQLPFNELTVGQSNLLEYFKEVDLCKPTECHFTKYEKGKHTIWSFFQNWQTCCFQYHTGINDYRGMRELFNLKDLPQDYFKTIDRFLHNEATPEEVELFVDELFAKLQGYDQVPIKFYPSDKGLNIPYEILLLKFLRELLCNPYIAIYNQIYPIYNPTHSQCRGLFMIDVIRILMQGLPEERREKLNEYLSYSKEYQDKFGQFIHQINLRVAQKYSWYHQLYRDAQMFTYNETWELFESLYYKM